MQNSKHRVGIMGGTFDPIHIGHLMLGECAYEQFQLEKVMFMPSGNPPHKRQRVDGASDEQRTEMVRRAIADNPRFELNTEEMERKGLTYTNETLRQLNEKHPDTDFYFIIGGDSLMSFDSWKNPEIICQNCILVAAVRDQLDLGTMREKMQELKEKYGAEIHLLKTPDVDISSSSLRQWCHEKRSIRYYVPESVREYIFDEHVYDACVHEEATKAD